ncbi:hypothetical protein BOX15_Mlig029566g1 [Macrostomum lignano]|uniref:Uncharacterized protein n=2 Tax=Macrostomum lignano TaxID=282301 RepID=A0A267FJ50_9PLAT|nr:hypothetical protein BOX15_Mlig029566g2 [Macrostomum lignano]PAA80954.1 hypothetical protein BOX15_Mlig029566g1 [Macrostomum lignano]
MIVANSAFGLLLGVLCFTAAADSKAVVHSTFIGKSFDVFRGDRTSLALINLVQPRTMKSSLIGTALHTAPDCTPGTKLSHKAAWAMCSVSGIGIRSSTGRIGCRDVGCTSLEQVRCNTVIDIVAFKKACGCQSVVITGGTEKGHASGKYSHYNGYKLDIALNSCISSYIQANFRYSGKRPGGAELYTDGRGNVYALESNHWDIVYYK